MFPKCILPASDTILQNGEEQMWAGTKAWRPFELYVDFLEMPPVLAYAYIFVILRADWIFLPKICSNYGKKKKK